MGLVVVAGVVSSDVFLVISGLLLAVNDRVAGGAALGICGILRLASFTAVTLGKSTPIRRPRLVRD
jgi:hypothetical protein